MTVSRRTVWIWALQESKLNYAYSAFHARSTAKGNSHRQVRHDTDRTVLSCLLWRVNWVGLTARQVSSVSDLCRSVSGGAVRPPNALVGQTQFTSPDTTQTALSCSVWRVVWIGHYATSNHGLRGSASPVLTATGFVNGRWQFSAATESTPLDRSPKNLVQVITSAAPTAVPNLVQIRPRGASGQMGEI